jgi:deoxyribodipyrimidine photolyase-related protein
MDKVTLIFPHQLFKNHPAINKSRVIYLIEDPLFFGDENYPAKFHKQKLVFHRASMIAYKNYLEKKRLKVNYINYCNNGKTLGPNYLLKLFKENKPKEIHFADVVDFILEKRIKRCAEQLNIKIEKYQTSMFVSDESWLEKYFVKKKKYLMASFYSEQRRRLNILMEGDKPIGSKWSFDDENRKKIPQNISLPGVKFPKENKHVTVAKDYVEKNFKSNPGSADSFFYPVNHKEAEGWFNDFLKNRFGLFGDYEDAIAKDELIIYHSVLSPLLNSGLLTPEYVTEKSIEFASQNKIPLNSLEGFVRQIIGWREFIRIIYEREGVSQRNSNYFGFKKKMPEAFYNATTKIEPVDLTIEKLLNHSYLHHIERLMVLGNFMLLCEINPKEIYKWFMELFIDAYDWVMVPNVYGMSQFADGGLMSTKPYISSSNYILKMSDYKKGSWCKVWDGLYWRFLSKHKNLFAHNPRMNMMMRLLEKMDSKKLSAHIKAAEDYLSKLQ